MHTRDFDYFIDRLITHNELFPNVAYEIIGFSKNSKDDISVVLKQPYVKNAELATITQILEWLQNNGWKSVGSGRYTNGRYTLSDVKPQNVLNDKNGDLRFIDFDIERVKGDIAKSEDVFEKDESPR